PRSVAAWFDILSVAAGEKYSSVIEKRRSGKVPTVHFGSGNGGEALRGELENLRLSGPTGNQHISLLQAYDSVRQLEPSLSHSSGCNELPDCWVIDFCGVHFPLPVAVVRAPHDEYTPVVKKRGRMFVPSNPHASCRREFSSYRVVDLRRCCQ